MNIVEFSELPYEEVQRRAKELGYSKAVATRAYNLSKLSRARIARQPDHSIGGNVTLDESMLRVKGLGGKTAEFIAAV